MGGGAYSREVSKVGTQENNDLKSYNKLADFNHSKSYKVLHYDKLNKLKLADFSDLNTSNKSDLNQGDLTKNNQKSDNSSSSKTYLLKSQVVTTN